MTVETARTAKKPVSYIRKYCDNRWETVLRHLAPQLGDVIDKAGAHATNPVTGIDKGMRTLKSFQRDGATYVSEGIGFGNSDGIETLMYVLNCSQKEAVKMLMDYLRGSEIDPVAVKQRQSEIEKNKALNEEKEKARCARAKKNLALLAQQCVPLDVEKSVVPVYLLRRGLGDLPKSDFPSDVFFVDSLKYYHELEDKTVMEGYFPAMVSAVRNYKGEIVSFHRTYLDVSGRKADVPEPKKLAESHHSITGSAIRLYQPKRVLGLAEGIETALAVRTVTGMPIWSTINANGLESVNIPAGVTDIVIWADLDKSGTGQNAAIRLQEQLVLAGYRVIIFLPKGTVPRDKKSVDWLDVLNDKGTKGFPCVKKIMAVDREAA